MTPDYDVTVIGAGIVGSAIARQLAGHQLSVALIDARGDVGDGTSKANTAILHTGFDAKPGTLESRLVRRGYQLLSQYAVGTGIPIERTGAILVAWDAEQLATLPSLREQAEANGYDRCEIVDAATVYARLPHLGPGALGGLTVPDESIICTWTVNLALATDAVNRGAALLLDHRVESVRVESPATILHTTAGPITTGWVVNAAGLGADRMDAQFGYSRFTVTPRRGELIVYDKLARRLADTIVLPVPTSRGKGVLISPTIYGNVMLGPTSEDLTDRTATGTSRTGLESLLDKGSRLMPELLDEEITATYAGLRAAIDRADYLIEADPAQRYLLVGGIRSTGLTAGMAIAECALGVLGAAGLQPEPKAALPDPPQMPNLGEAFTRPYQDPEAIRADPAYGRIVCFCERVTEGELRDACRSVIPPSGLDGLRRRTRVMNGRCQGFFCGAEVQSMFEALR
ncbi:MAG TPA: NAD(P)/FAD-dependent oxidoreductase [Mycobacterium sp.]|nr:NAD(P)/FAD-dependent oxidoreductase [Mycobacterium sp.]